MRPLAPLRSPPLRREWTWLKRKAEHKTADKDNRVAHEGVQGIRGRVTREHRRERVKTREEQ